MSPDLRSLQEGCRLLAVQLITLGDGRVVLPREAGRIVRLSMLRYKFPCPPPPPQAWRRRKGQRRDPSGAFFVKKSSERTFRTGWVLLMPLILKPPLILNIFSRPAPSPILNLFEN